MTAGTESPLYKGTPTSEFPSVGNMFKVVQDQGEVAWCTAQLVAPNVVLLAEHCVVLDQLCQPKLDKTVSFRFPGSATSYLTNPLRVYAPGLDMKQVPALIEDQGLSFDGSTLKCSGVPTELYTYKHPDQDFALVGIAPAITTVSSSDMFPRWDVLPALVPGAVAATWVGRRFGKTTLEYQGTISQTSLLEFCDYTTKDAYPTTLQTDAPFFFADIATTDPVGATERGDSGAAVLVSDGGWRVAGVLNGFRPKQKTGKPAACPPDPDPPGSGPGFNVWSSLVSHGKAYDDFLECAKNDLDCDGVKNAEDNCKDTPNVSQANWNLEVENTLGSPEMGNSCDPSPVAQSTLNGEEFLVFGPLSGSCNPSTPAPYEACKARALSYEMDVSTVWMVQDKGVNVPADARTGFRYCICRDLAGNPILSKAACRDIWGCIYDPKLFPRPEGFGPDETRFLKMTVYQEKPKFSGGALTPGNDWEKENGEVVAYQAGLVPLARFATWNWHADAPAWKAAGFWWDVPADNYPVFPDIPGIIWTHNDSLLGSAAHGVPGTGFGDSYTFAWPARKTSACPIVPDINDIVGSSAGPPGASASSESAVSGSGQPPLPPCTEAGQKHCAPIPARWLQARQHVINVPLLANVTNDVNDPQMQKVALAGRLLESSFAAPCGSKVARISVRQPPLLLKGVFSDELESALLHPAGLTWVLPSEAPENHRHSAFPAAVAVDSSGSVSFTMVVGSDGHLTLGSGLPAIAAIGSTDAGPSAYSRIRGTVYQVLSSTLTGPFDTLRIRSLSGSIQDLPLLSAEALPAVGKAVVFTERDRRLWLIGTSGAGSPSSLHVIDTDTGSVEAVRHFVSGLDRFWMATGPDNAVALIAAPDAQPWYRIVLFEPETNITPGRPRTAGVVQRQARPLGTLRVDGGAVLVPESPIGKNKPAVLEAIVVELAALRAAKGGAVFIDEK